MIRSSRRRARSPRPSVGRRSEETSERILDAAGRCISRFGFDGTSMDDIAREAGVSKGLIVYHFESKEQLLLAVQRRAYGNLADGIAALAATEGPSMTQAFAAFDRVWGLLVALRDQIPFTLELVAQATRRPDAATRLQELNDEVTQLIERALRNTLGSAVADLPLPPERLAIVLHLIISGLALHAHFAPSLETAQRTYNDLRLLLTRVMATEEGR